MTIYSLVKNMNNFRPATSQDANILVSLVSESSGGVWPAIWRELARNGESIEAAGARYLVNAANNLSIGNATVAEFNGDPIRVIICYQEVNVRTGKEKSQDSATLSNSLTNALRPYRELRDPDGLFISELCILPEARGKGLGSQFLKFAAQSAMDRGLPRLSLRVFSGNSGAVRLYQRSGFEVLDDRSIVPHSGFKYSGSVLLMTCAVSSVLQ